MATVKKIKKQSDHLEELWNSRYLELKRFKKQHSHCIVPQNDKRFSSLARWCVKQRINKKLAKIKVPDYRIKNLDKIGFCWNILDLKFEIKYQELKHFKKQHGHCNVPEKTNAALFKWCTKLRAEKKNEEKRLSASRIKKITTLGFEWEVVDMRWMKKYDALQKYIEKNGHFFILKDSKKYKTTASFVINLRMSYKAGKLSKEKIELLNKIGFVWSPYNANWEKKFEELRTYKSKFGHCNVSMRKADFNYIKLADWVSEQRENFKNKSKLLTKERIQKLSSIGFNWTSPYKVGEQNRINDTDLINELKRLQILLKKTPSTLDIQKHGKYDSVSYYNHFGNIRDARKKAGLKSRIPRKDT